jgi:hypothetical protein
MENKKLNRQQQRQVERINEEVGQVFKRLTDQFLDDFVESENPESGELKVKITDLSSKWKAYCRSKGIIKEMFDAVEKRCNKLVQDYGTYKHNGPVAPEPTTVQESV